MLKLFSKVFRFFGGEPVGIHLADSILRNWTTDAEFILDNKHKYNQNDIGRFAYNPRTNELVWGPMSEQHAIMIGNQASSPFDDFVRGVYTNGKVMLRWYSTDPMASSEEIKLQSFEAWYATKDMLARNGLPPGVPVEIGVSTAQIQEDVGRFYR